MIVMCSVYLLLSCPEPLCYLQAFAAPSIAVSGGVLKLSGCNRRARVYGTPSVTARAQMKIAENVILPNRTRQCVYWGRGTSGWDEAMYLV